MTDLSPHYNPKDVEERLYAQWESQGLFAADVDPKRTPYTIVIPPPNVTGILHMGHALNNTIQDILIRWKRMQGFNALWVPGTDHAGIATQNVVERALAKEGRMRQDLGREAFIKRVWAWKEQYGNTILYQLKRLGSSCDWRRTRFTMDEGLSEAVLEVFLRLYDKGLIYRGSYIINWCPRCQTALADEEAPRVETQGKLYHIRYPLAEGSRLKAQGKDQPRASFIEVATTRPETMLGDTAIAVHPKDKRYKALIGKHAILPLVNRKLPIIADDAVDRTFGTGAVKVTPAHDPVDFQMGRKHKLDFINVMTDDAHMTNVPAAYEGLDRLECRSKLIVDLEQAGFLGPIDEHPHNVGHCYRCHTAIEPRLSPQWFVRMKPLAKPAIKAVKDGTITFLPGRWKKVYLNWMEHIEDWCISRQIWWGHRIPVWYCDTCVRGSGLGAQPDTQNPEPKSRRAQSPQPSAKGMIVSKTPPAECPSCGGTELRQDEDVLDTWFSSWLWPFSTLGWPQKTKDLTYFYPTNALVTAQEIIFFWVARMIMAGYFCMKKPPFTQVYIHGTVRDITGKKMSKSLGNIIDPLQIIEQFGTDALRYTLVTSTAIGQDIVLSEERFAAGRNFANKLWNATRFALSAAQGSELRAQPDTQNPEPKSRRAQSPEPSALTVPDRWVLSQLQRTIDRVTTSLEKCLFNDAASTLYEFIWHDVCDWYLEMVKVALAQGSGLRAQYALAQSPEPRTALQQSPQPPAQSIAVLVHVLETSVRLLHPVMPYITEELWQHLKPLRAQGSGLSPERSIMRAAWPRAEKPWIDAEAESLIGQLQAVIGAIRNSRAELNVPLDSRPAVQLGTKRQSTRAFFESHTALLQALAHVGELTVGGGGARPKDAAAAVVDGIDVVIPLAGLIDPAKERARLQQRIQELSAHRDRLSARLRDRAFTRKAPADVVQQTKTQLEHTQDTIKKLSEHLAVIQAM